MTSDRGDSVPATVARTRPSEFGSLTLAEVAVAYERAVLELTTVSDQLKSRALMALAETILPLVGTIALDDVTPELRRGVASVLEDELDDGDQWVVVVWNDFVRWSSFHLPRR